MSEQKQKQKLKELIESVDYIDESEKSKWIDLLADLNDEEMKKVYKYFQKNQKKELDTALAIIFEENMEEDLHKEINQIKKKYKKKFKK